MGIDVSDTFFRYQSLISSAVYRRRLQVNDLSCVLLSILLLPCLLKAPKELPQPRLVIVSSDNHYHATLEKEISSPGILARLNEKEHCTFEYVSFMYAIRNLVALTAFGSVMSHRYEISKCR